MINNPKFEFKKHPDQLYPKYFSKDEFGIVPLCTGKQLLEMLFKDGKRPSISWLNRRRKQIGIPYYKISSRLIRYRANEAFIAILEAMIEEGIKYRLFS